MPERYFREINEPILFDWIGLIRNAGASSRERGSAEVSLTYTLYPIADWFAHLGLSRPQFDTDQAVNDAVCKLMVVYVRDPDFHIRSCGHLIGLLRQITTNECRLACRSNRRAKRVPHDIDGRRLRIESLDIVPRHPVSRLDDPARDFERNELIEHCLQSLGNPNHKQVFLMLSAEYTRDEIAVKLKVDRKTVRRWIDQLRRILAPQASSLASQASKAC